MEDEDLVLEAEEFFAAYQLPPIPLSLSEPRMEKETISLHHITVGS